MSLVFRLGARLYVNRMPVTVVGVMPPTFFGVEVGRVLDVAMPARLAAPFTSTPFDDDTQWLNIMVRLKSGANGQLVLKADSSFDYEPVHLHPEDYFSINGKAIAVVKRPRP